MSTKAQAKTQAKTLAALAAARIPQPPVAVPEREAARPDIATELEGAARLGHSLGAISVDSSPPPIIQRQELPEEDEEELQMKREPAAIQRQERPEEEEEGLQMRPESAAIQHQELPDEEDEELQMKREPAAIQRQVPKEEEDELQMMPEPSPLQRQELPDEEEELQTKPANGVQRQDGGEGFQLDDETVGRINRARGSGQPLDGSLQTQMSAVMGHDFSGVRVHTDSEADDLNRQLSAQAFTTGQDIFLRTGAYNPTCSSGRGLIAHELSHVVQQGMGRVPGGGSGMTARPAGDAFEQEADALGRQAVTQSVAETKEEHTPEIRQAIDPAPQVLQPSRAAHGEGTVQRETFMEQREIRSRYAGEEKKQRPGLEQDILFVVQQLKYAYQAYQDALKSKPPKLLEVFQKRRQWQERYTFLKKQDVEVTKKGAFDPKSLKGRLVKYDKTRGAQARTKIAVSGGRFLRHNGQPVDTKDSVTYQKGLGWEIFVMGPGGDIHMASHKIGKYHHSSLLGGGNVAAAGSMRVSGGTLQELNNRSGHYMPQEEHIRQVLRLLQTKGVSLGFTLEIMGVGTYSAKAYMQSGGKEAFEKGTTQHVLKHFMKAKGRTKVKDAFTGAGWKWLALLSGKFDLKKPDGTKATHKEVRDFLTGQFGEVAAPHVT